jgi:hypothetical protein
MVVLGGLCVLAAPAAAKKLPNLEITKISNPKASAHPGDQLSVTDTLKNAGSVKAKASKARFYLSVDRNQGPGDIRLAGVQKIGKLQPGAKAQANGSFGIPNSTAGGKYFLIGCADDTKAVSESNEKDNCLSSKHKVKVAPKAPKVTTPYAVNAGDFPIGKSVELDGLEVTAVGSGGLFWVEVPTTSPDFTDFPNSALEAAIRFSPPPTLHVADRVDLVGKVEAGGFEMSELGATSVDVTDTNQINNVPVNLSDAQLQNPPADLDAVLTEVSGATKDSESLDHHQWIMENPQMTQFGIDDLVIGTLPTVANGSMYGLVVGVADTDTSQVVISPRSTGDLQN